MTLKEKVLRTDLILKDIEQQYALAAGEDESDEILSTITRDTIKNGRLIDVPGENSKVYDKDTLEKYQTNEDLRNRVDQILNAGGVKPESLYVLSEEESISDWGLTKFPYDAALDIVVPYIRSWGQPSNFWITDGKTTITFHRNGTMYWKKPEKPPFLT